MIFRPPSDFGGPVRYFSDPDQNRTHDEFEVKGYRNWQQLPAGEPSTLTTVS